MGSSTEYSRDEVEMPYVFSNGAYIRLPVYEQSVSIVASLDESDSSPEEGSKNLLVSLGLTDKEFPIVVGVGVGVVLLLTFIIIVLVCSCRKQRSKKNHSIYSVQTNSSNHCDLKHDNMHHSAQSDSMVIVTGKEGFNKPYESYLVEMVKDSNSAQQGSRKVRPFSQPVEYLDGPESYMSATLPKGNQKTVQSCEFLSEVSPSLFISCEELDENFSRERTGTIEQMLNSSVKTRSLPNWGKSRPRPLSTTGDMQDLCTKVKCTKKRKNRMKNDTAAAIALTKSRTNLLTHTDTDSLVDNEAVVVYDERTAL